MVRCWGMIAERVLWDAAVAAAVAAAAAAEVCAVGPLPHSRGQHAA